MIGENANRDSGIVIMRMGAEPFRFVKYSNLHQFTQNSGELFGFLSATDSLRKILVVSSMEFPHITTSLPSLSMPCDYITTSLHPQLVGLEHFLFFHILGMSSSQLTNSNLFQRGFSSTTNQPAMCLSTGNPFLMFFFAQ